MKILVYFLSQLLIATEQQIVEDHTDCEYASGELQEKRLCRTISIIFLHPGNPDRSLARSC